MALIFLTAFRDHYSWINFQNNSTCWKAHLLTKPTCWQRPPVDKDHLLTKTTCWQRPHVDKDHMLTKTTCWQIPHVDKYHMLTKTTCWQRPPVDKDHLLTNTTCWQRPFLTVHYTRSHTVVIKVYNLWKHKYKKPFLWDVLQCYTRVITCPT